MHRLAALGAAKSRAFLDPMCIIAVVERLEKPDREKRGTCMYTRQIVKTHKKENVCASLVAIID